MATYFVQNTNSVEDIEQMNNVIDKVNKVNTEATSNIGQLTELNTKAEDLSNNIKQALPINTELKENIKVGQPLVQEAASKNTELQVSLEKAKEFIDGLDGSQDIPGIRMELTELQNGLKSNQVLAYQGSSISANDTLEGRTEGMRIGGRTLVNCILTPIINRTYTANSTQQMYNYKVLRKANATYTIIAFISKNTLNNNFSLLSWGRTSNGNPITVSNGEKGLIKKTFTTNDNTEDWFLELWKENTTGEIKIDYIMVLEGDWTNEDVPSYFEGIKSFGEAEQEGDKHKISILSNGKNLFDFTKYKEKIKSIQGVVIKEDGFIADCDNSGAVGNNLLKTTQILKGYFKPNCQYFFDYKVVQEGRFNGGFIYNYTDGTTSSCKFASQVGKTINYIGFTFGTQVYGGKTIFSEIMLIEGSNKPIYEPYQSDKKDILISAPLPGFDFGEDIMYEENGQVKVTRNIDTYTFTGDETMRDTTEQDEKSGTGKYKVFALTVNKTIDINKNINNNFPKEQFNVAFQNMDSEGLSVTQYGVYIKILKSKLSTQDIEGLKAWLKANTTTIYFARATPVTEIVENCIDIDLDTYQEKTYFNILNSLPGTLDFKVPSNIASIVQSNSKAINELYDLINNIVMPGMAEIVDKTVKASINLAK